MCIPGLSTTYHFEGHPSLHFDLYGNRPSHKQVSLKEEGVVCAPPPPGARPGGGGPPCPPENNTSVDEGVCV